MSKDTSISMNTDPPLCGHTKCHINWIHTNGNHCIENQPRDPKDVFLDKLKAFAIAAEDVQVALTEAAFKEGYAFSDNPLRLAARSREWLEVQVKLGYASKERRAAHDCWCGDKHTNPVTEAVGSMDLLTDEERVDVMLLHYCGYCGCKDPTCQCWNDE